MGARCSSVRSGRRMPSPCAQGFALLRTRRNPAALPARGARADAGDGRQAHPSRRQAEFALVAAEPLPPGEALVGAVARAAITDSGREAEFAILVSHYIAGLGLGRHLMRRLVRWAKGRRLERLWGDVLEHNQPMLALASRWASVANRRSSRAWCAWCWSCATDPRHARRAPRRATGRPDRSDRLR